MSDFFSNTLNEILMNWLPCVMWNRGIIKMHKLAAKYSWICIGRKHVGVNVLSESEVLVMFVTVDGEESVRKISERQN